MTAENEGPRSNAAQKESPVTDPIVAHPEPDHVAIALRIANFIWLAVNNQKGAK